MILPPAPAPNHELEHAYRAVCERLGETLHEMRWLREQLLQRETELAAYQTKAPRRGIYR